MSISPGGGLDGMFGFSVACSACFSIRYPYGTMEITDFDRYFFLDDSRVRVRSFTGDMDMLDIGEITSTAAIQELVSLKARNKAHVIRDVAKLARRRYQWEQKPSRLYVFQ